MSLPKEVLITTLKVHQRYLCLEDDMGHLSPFFIVVSNMETANQGELIIQGNEKVARARLSDGAFCYALDCKESLEEMVQRLDGIVFFDTLGTMGEKAARLEKLASYLAPYFQVNPQQASLAARLSKADLASQMVGEFPELQGVMGGYYSQALGVEELSQAIACHYSPKGPEDSLPQTALGRLVSLCDKLDTLGGFFAIGQLPTSSKDPYALRRACLGTLRLLEKEVGVSLSVLFEATLQVWEPFFEANKLAHNTEKTREALAQFFADRLRVLWKEQGYAHDQIQAILPRENKFFLKQPIADFYARLQAMHAFLQTPEGPLFVAACKRVANILSAIKLDADHVLGNPGSFITPEEQTLALRLQKVLPEIENALDQKQIGQAYAHALPLLQPLNAFFEAVQVNCDDEKLRAQRVLLLTKAFQVLEKMGDFTNISA